MRAELPWNVAGIPPEAREAARAAARREGLSVGEWLTRRILRSFSGMEEELAPMPYENRAPMGASLDSWGLPPSAASRRDSTETMAQTGLGEHESNEAWGRIEDQLKGLSRRLDSSERSQGESNPVLSHATQEMNIAAREQSQAFDQLGLTVVALNERLERLERSAAHDGIRDAVKALHQGLSRLADQINATASNSASQVVQLTSNLEQLAGRVGNSEEVNKALEARIHDVALAVDNRLDAIDRSLETRFSAVEKTAQFNSNALDHALEKIEASANQRATDQVENQKRAARHEETLHRLEDSIARLEMRLPDAEFERRLDGIERSVSGMAGLLEDHGAADRFEASLEAMSHRLDAMEKDHQDALAELRIKAPQPTEPTAHEAPEVEDVPQPAAQVIEPPPYAELPPAHDMVAELAPPPSHVEDATDAFNDYATPQDFAEADAAHVIADADIAHIFSEPDTGPSSAENVILHGFLEPATPHGFAFDTPPEAVDPFAAPEFEDVAVDRQEPDNFLAQARRSARAAAEKTESERSGLGTFRWSKDAAAHGEEKAKPRYLLPVLVAMLVVAVAAAALVLSQRAKRSDAAATPVNRSATGLAYSITSRPASHDTQSAAAAQAANQSGNEKNFATQRSEPAGQDNASPTAALPAQQEASNAPVNPMPSVAIPNATKPNSAAPATGRAIQLANAGNPIALTILGLRDLDGTGGTAVNLPDALKLLSQAAEKGQAVAQYRLGTLYERGQGVPVDAAKAAHWYELSANQGNRKAMHNLAVSYASGTTGKKDMAEAARWFAKAAALGLSDSQFNLAVLYERGDGVPQSLMDAYKWYSIAAATGDSESKQRMGVLQTQLSDADKAAANKSAASFHATPLNRSANVPPELADLGR